MTAKRTLILIVMAALWPAMTLAQVNSKNQGYLIQGADSDITTSGTGLCWRDSDWTPARAAAAAACNQCSPDLCPKPVAAAQPPLPPPIVTPRPAPPKEEPQKILPKTINFSADTLFDFDKAVLKPDGAALLDNLVRELYGASYQVILAIGHTDRIGSVAYNQKLSMRRADAVKNYLVRQGIPADIVHVEGRGKTQPITKPDDCKGLPRNKLIACLQPDRRVDIEVH